MKTFDIRLDNASHQLRVSFERAAARLVQDKYYRPSIEGIIDAAMNGREIDAVEAAFIVEKMGSAVPILAADKILEAWVCMRAAHPDLSDKKLEKLKEVMEGYVRQLDLLQPQV